MTINVALKVIAHGDARLNVALKRFVQTMINEYRLV